MPTLPLCKFDNIRVEISLDPSSPPRTPLTYAAKESRTYFTHLSRSNQPKPIATRNKRINKIKTPTGFNMKRPLNITHARTPRNRSATIPTTRPLTLSDMDTTNMWRLRLNLNFSLQPVAQRKTFLTSHIPKIITIARVFLSFRAP